jgi:hypothetical protein
VAPAVVLPLAAEAVRYARREASRALAAVAVRQPVAAAVLRARAAVAAGQAGAVELPREAAAGAALLGGAEAEEVPRAGAAVRQLAVGAPRDAGQQRAVLASAWVFHPDQLRPWPARPPSGRFVRAMKVQRIALP